MDKRIIKIILILAILALAAFCLWPLIVYAIEKSKKEEAKLETIAQTEQPATSTPTIQKSEGETGETESPKQSGTYGTASWYDYSLSGAPNFSRENATAASRDYPRGTILRVTNTKTGAYVDVRVNDYGPEAWTDRSIDLSSFAFSQIANLRDGLAHVSISEK